MILMSPNRDIVTVGLMTMIRVSLVSRLGDHQFLE